MPDDVTKVIARLDWGAVLRSTLVPQISLQSTWLVAALRLLGTTISPYMLFWQADEDAEDNPRGVNWMATLTVVALEAIFIALMGS